MSKTFKGVELSLGPGGVYPKNSRIEAIERRRIAGEEAIQSLERQKVHARERQSLSRAAVRGKFAKRDQWIREQYVLKSDEHSSYSIHSFREDLLTAWSNRHVKVDSKESPIRRVLETSAIRVPEKFWKLLRHDRKLIGEERLRKIIETR